MDLIRELSAQLGVEAPKAEAVAGGLFGLVEQQLGGSADAAELGKAVPELSRWKESAASMLGAAPSGGALGGLLGGGGGEALAGALGGLLGGGGGGALGGLSGLLGAAGGELGAIAGLLSKLGISPEQAATLAPLAISFLKSRVSPELLGKLMQAVPLLSQGQGAGLGGLAGAVSGLFGKP